MTSIEFLSSTGDTAAGREITLMFHVLSHFKLVHFLVFTSGVGRGRSYYRCSTGGKKSLGGKTLEETAGNNYRKILQVKTLEENT